MDPKTFSLKKKSIPIQVETPEGVSETYSLVEISGKERDEFVDQMTNRMKFNAKGEPCGLKTFAGLQASLLCLCLLDQDGKRIAKDALQDFPASVVNELYKMAQELSALDQPGQEAAKNE